MKKTKQIRFQSVVQVPVAVYLAENRNEPLGYGYTYHSHAHPGPHFFLFKTDGTYLPPGWYDLIPSGPETMVVMPEREQ